MFLLVPPHATTEDFDHAFAQRVVRSVQRRIEPQMQQRATMHRQARHRRGRSVRLLPGIYRGSSDATMAMAPVELNRKK